MHIVIWGEGITPIFAAQWLRKLSSTVDITILSRRGKLGYSINLLPLYAVGKLSENELIPFPLKYIENVLRVNVVLNGYKLNLREKIIHLNDEKIGFDFLVLALCPRPLNLMQEHLEKAKCPWNIDDAKEIRSLICNASEIILAGDFLTSINLYNLLIKLGYKCRIFVDDFSIHYLDDDLYRLIMKIIGKNILLKDPSKLRKADLLLYNGSWRLPKELINIGLRVGKFGVLVDDLCLSNYDFVYVIGGCAEHSFSYGIRYIPLSEGLHEVESLVMATNVLKVKSLLKLKRIFGSLYCECGQYSILVLGSTVQEARNAGRTPTSVRLRGREHVSDAIVKVVMDKSSMRVIGVHIISSRKLGPLLASYAHFVSYLDLPITDLITIGAPSGSYSVTILDPLLEALRASWYKLLWSS